jgi:ATP-dependent RNA helicase RhlE
MPETQNQGFAALNLPQSILDKLDRAGFVTPTPIQERASPIALRGNDLIGIAQTGTGKTLAFGLPMAVRLTPGNVGLVLAPTRELADQIEETLYKLGFKTALLIGGEGMGRQISQLRNRPNVIVATPGRLEDHMARGTVDISRVSIVVLDEADRMLDMGFAPAIRRIVSRTPRERQTMLFSATMPREIADLAKDYLRQPERVEIQPAGTAAEGVKQELLMVSHENKSDTLRELLEEHAGTVLVFARTRHGARKVAKAVRTFGHTAAELHSDRTLAQRRAALDGFKSGEHRVLVATDIAARGIDVKEIALVINYDCPENAEDYVHRIGRTGRAGAKGHAILIATPEQHQDVRDIERLLRSALELSPRSQKRPERPTPAPRATSPKQFQHRSGPKSRPGGGSTAHGKPRRRPF